MSAFIIDAFEFSRLKERREGEVAVASLQRLAAECVNPSTSLRWSLQGGVDGSGHPQLIMSVTGIAQLRCQRCMAPFEFDIAAESVLVLAKTEAHADEIEESLADDSIDVIVGSKALNILELIEDEALLAIPLAPKHDVCPGNAAVDGLAGAKKPSPFDVLKNIKQQN
jgi:uncharacterized protein